MIGPSDIKIQKTGAKESATVIVACPLLILAFEGSGERPKASASIRENSSKSWRR
jgi:hypothetical protein